MCGRINVSDHAGIQRLLEWLQIPLFPKAFQPRFNITPGASILTVLDHENAPEFCTMEWGLVPPWAKPNQFARPLINARAETIWEKPSFRNLISQKRTIIPVNGFYEWKRNGDKKSAYHIHAPDDKGLALGGIYQINKDGVMQCSVVTTAANHAMAEIHDRMPVLLTPDSADDWLHNNNKQRLDEIMQPPTDKLIKLTPVSPYVNNAQHEGPRCIEPEKQQEDLF
ncbi:MAG: SOS response-associated peptidase [Gammaproteobacteria bacterium]|nr:SOS response-associated peptidase [Gammaproteobacteria bacterium]